MITELIVLLFCWESYFKIQFENQQILSSLLVSSVYAQLISSFQHVLDKLCQTRSHH